MRDNSLWRGDYPRRAKRVRDVAYANPDTRCRRCGCTRAEVLALGWTPRQASWQAGHVVDGERTSPLAAEHARCNEEAGGRRGAAVVNERNRNRNRNRSARNEERSPNAVAAAVGGGPLMAQAPERLGARPSPRTARAGGGTIVAVVGPPCSGKSTHVREHAVAGDVVVDFDAIARAIGSPKEHDHDEPFIGLVCAAREALLERFARARNRRRLWVIATRRRQLGEWGLLGCEVVEMTTSIDECLRRAQAAGRSPDAVEAIRRYDLS